MVCNKTSNGLFIFIAGSPIVLILKKKLNNLTLIVSRSYLVLRLITAFLFLLSAPIVFADAHWSDWSDKTMCRLARDTGLDQYRQAALDRGLSCAVDQSASSGFVVAKTNIEGLLINNFRCSQGKHYTGSIVNNTQQHIYNVVIKSFDYDGAELGSCRKYVGLSPESSDSFLAFNCGCEGWSSYDIDAQ